MTCGEKLAIKHPECVGDEFTGGYKGCPHDYGYLPKSPDCYEITCKECWNKEIPETESRQDNVHDKPAFKSTERLIADIQTLLMDANHPWSLNYTPDDQGGSGSYTIWIGGNTDG